jgi:hypothetical protein
VLSEATKKEKDKDKDKIPIVKIESHPQPSPSEKDGGAAIERSVSMGNLPIKHAEDQKVRSPGKKADVKDPSKHSRRLRQQHSAATKKEKDKDKIPITRPSPSEKEGGAAIKKSASTGNLPVKHIDVPKKKEVDPSAKQFRSQEKQLAPPKDIKRPRRSSESEHSAEKGLPTAAPKVITYTLCYHFR